ncbi:hypothetical protein FCL47_13980 [Desulfopila sp. IMCC35006]|uniref:hypothetical protein n=1 Tax=Desulfopila sp. IMCC35006 TaxID=2569542 RepID=UPI0010AB8FF3|nr:hypothetical protein [Desulfopila sp. IMCC35006]TKB25636.1 hypothetical protein FCL47_13980 [Desulfopila sp. IMCC35006]
MHDDTPDTYLCQVNETVSCGACCGLYNLPNLSRKKLETILAQRTETFASVPRTEDGIFTFKRSNKGPHRLSRPFPGFHHCPFLGFIGERKRCVGCLLHPAAPGNNGVDYRSLSWYGELACRTYLCPATQKLSAVYKSILTQTLDNWYVFGLIVTEHALVTAYFKEMEIRLGRPVAVDDYRQNIGATVAFREFAELKIQWPYRRPESPGPCNFFFENGLYPRPAVLRNTLDIRPSSYETILQELDSGFSSAKEMAMAEQLLDDLFLKTEKAIVQCKINTGGVI